MNLFLIGVLSVCALFAIKTEAFTEQQKRNMVRVIGKNCQIIENATEEEFETLIERNIPTTKGGKCLKACILETLSMLNDGKLSSKAIAEMARVATDNDERLVNIATEIAEECSEITDSDRCELAYKLSICEFEGARKRNMDPREWQ